MLRRAFSFRAQLRLVQHCAWLEVGTASSMKPLSTVRTEVESENRRRTTLFFPYDNLAWSRMFFRILLFCWMALGRTAILQAGPTRFIHEFAQVGDGGGSRFVFLVQNQNTGQVTIELEFFKDDEKVLTLTIGNTTASSFEFLAPVGGTLKIETSGSSTTAQVGCARLTAAGSVGAPLLFEIIVDGNLMTQAAIESTRPLRVFDLFMRSCSGTNSGIALGTITGVNVCLTLQKYQGEEVATTTVQVAGQGRLIQFLTELFPEAGEIDGSIPRETSGPVTVIALQQTGLLLGTLPFIGDF